MRSAVPFIPILTDQAIKAFTLPGPSGCPVLVLGCPGGRVRIVKPGVMGTPTQAHGLGNWNAPIATADFGYGGGALAAARQPILWEWHLASGWTNLGASGTLVDDATIWFDEHRGRLMRCNTFPLTQNVMYRSGANTWATMPLQGGAVQMWTSRIAGYDEFRNRVYAYNAHSSAPGPGFFEDVFPAFCEAHHGQPPGCWTWNAPELWLTQPWTRAWIGGTMSVDVRSIIGLPGPIAIVAMGLDDQSYGGNPLPLSLGALGMTGCVLQVDPQVIFGAAVSGGVANVSLPIPNSTLLVGTEIFQQGFGFVPVANPLGMLPSYSIRATVGRSH